MYFFLSQKMENSSYEDELFKTYHYPKRYKKNIPEDDIFVDQQGDRANPQKRFYYSTDRIAVKKKAAGVCQPCSLEAPSLDGDGKSYLECFYVQWLADAGADSFYFGTVPKLSQGNACS